jgi:hypothetical protein
MKLVKFKFTGKPPRPAYIWDDTAYGMRGAERMIADPPKYVFSTLKEWKDDPNTFWDDYAEDDRDPTHSWVGVSWDDSPEENEFGVVSP